MDWSEKDPFDEIVRQFFGESPMRRRHLTEEFAEGEEEDRVIDFIEIKNKIYLIFELPGYSSKDISVLVKGRRIEIKAQKKDHSAVQEYLSSKLQQGISIKKTLPQSLDMESMKHTYRNGILEVSFVKNG